MAPMPTQTNLPQSALLASRSAASMFGHLAGTSVAPPQVAEGLEQVSRVTERYGEAAKAGWSPVPDVLLLNQAKLGLNSEDMNVLLNMMVHYYSPSVMPFVRPNVIAKRMGVSTRSVQRSIARMRKKGLIEKRLGPKREVIHDLTPLLTMLAPLARERVADKETRRVRKAQEQALLTKQPVTAEQALLAVMKGE